MPIFRGNKLDEQVKCFYEKLGHPDDNWHEVREYRYWEELKPKKKYCKTIGNYIKDIYPDADNQCIDLLERLLTYNPEQRISARTAIEHPFFSTEPLPCQPFEYFFS